MKFEVSTFELVANMIILFAFITILCVWSYHIGFKNGQTDAIANMYRMLVELI